MDDSVDRKREEKKENRLKRICWKLIYALSLLKKDLPIYHHGVRYYWNWQIFVLSLLLFIVGLGMSFSYIIEFGKIEQILQYETPWESIRYL